MDSPYEWKYEEKAFLPLPVVDKTHTTATAEEMFHRVNLRIEEILKELNDDKTLREHFGKKVTEEFVPYLRTIKSNLKTMHERITVEFQGIPYNPLSKESQQARDLVCQLYYRLELSMKPIDPSQLQKAVEEAVENSKEHAAQTAKILDDLSYISHTIYQGNLQHEPVDWEKYKCLCISAIVMGFEIAATGAAAAFVTISAALAGAGTGAIVCAVISILIVAMGVSLITKPEQLVRRLDKKAYLIEKSEASYHAEQREYAGKLASVVAEKTEIKGALPSVSEIPMGIFAAKTKLKDEASTQSGKDKKTTDNSP